MGAFDKYEFKPTGLGEQVSQMLTDAILDGTIREGDKLIETKLQQEFGISRSPIREALRELEKKGLVVIVQRKGAFVKEVTHTDIEEIFPTRSVLEGLAARLAYENMTEDGLCEMGKIYSRMEKAFANKNPKEYWKHHQQFHEIFIDACGNDTLIKIIRNLRMHTIWYRFSYRYYQEDFERSLRDHKTIFELLSRKDTDKIELEQFVRKHIQNALNKFIEYLGNENVRKTSRADESVN